MCESAGGKTKIFAMLEQLKAETESICVIADGAAIGPEMDALYKMSVEKGNIKLYLPESFEWIILSSELLEDKEIKDIMDKPENYIEVRNISVGSDFLQSCLWIKQQEHT